MAEESLLDYLSRTSGCQYLSDLRYDPSRRRAIRGALEQLSPQSFPLREWQDAVQYLLSRPVEGQSVEQLYQMLAESLSNAGRVWLLTR